MPSRLLHVVFAIGLASAVGVAFTPLGCGSSIPPAVPVSEDADLARQLRACAAEHENHLGSTSHSINFDVRLADDGGVDSVALRDATFRDDNLETCMARALRSLTADTLPMRLSGSRPRGPVAPESRAFLGQTPVPLEVGLEACLAYQPCAIALGLFVGASFIAVTVYVYTTANPGLVRLRPPITLATVLPTATAAPTTTAPPVPVTQVETEEEKKERCKKAKDRCIDDCLSRMGEGYRPPRQGKGARGRPGGGTNFQAKYKKCIDECMAAEGC